MSEYQYYEFQAIDRALGEAEMRALRNLSSRARITPTSFVNEYNYGDFRGSPGTLMERYFDAHLYLANWGTRRLVFRLPRRILDEKTAAEYCPGGLAEARRKGEFVVVEWNTEEDSGGGDWEEGEGWLAGLIPLRADLLRGDLRVVYLGWLLCAQAGELDDRDVEPPVPPGLARPSASLEKFAEFLRIDPALIEVAAEGQAEGDDGRASRKRLAAWVEGLPPAKKTDYLLRLVESDEPHVRAEVLAAFQRTERGDRRGAREGAQRRSVGTLLAAARTRAEENARRSAEEAARARALAKEKAARNKKKRLDALAKDETEAWQKVDTLVATMEPTKYDAAVKLLVDLRDSALRKGSLGLFSAKLDERRARYKTKQALLRRINKAGLRSAAS